MPVVLTSDWKQISELDIAQNLVLYLAFFYV
jgi:hypothetical protein